MMVAVGAAIGLGLAWIFIQAHKRLPTDAPSDIVLTLLKSKHENGLQGTETVGRAG